MLAMMDSATYHVLKIHYVVHVGRQLQVGGVLVEVLRCVAFRFRSTSAFKHE